MQITIVTIQGTFVVPANKEAELIAWLQQNAIKVGQQQIYEQTPQSNSYNVKQLITE
jgi:hypothetical protein